MDDYYQSLKINRDDKDTTIGKIDAQYQRIQDLLNTPYPVEKSLANDKDSIDGIKHLLDSIKELQWFIKPLLGKGTEAIKEEKFYGELVPIWNELDTITPLYNKVRNYITRKPYSEEKIKLNFDNSYFLHGWSKEYDSKAGLIFVKDNNYYLGINDKKLSIDDRERILSSNSKNQAIRIILDFQKPEYKNIPRIFIRSKGDNFAPAIERYNLPIHSIIDIYDNGKFKTEYKKINEKEYKKSLHTLIDYFKEGFLKHDSYKHYEYLWKETKEYNDISEFYKDVEISCYKVLEERINWDALIDLVNEGKLYLFQIYNKDFSPHSKGNPNIHTLYWKMIFDPQNLADVVYKLNGEAEVFYRKASIRPEDVARHRAQQPVMNKNPHNQKSESIFDYDLIKDRRYTVNKFQFHVPITLNFKDKGFTNINPVVNEYLKKTDTIHVIGIDRGERHLLYLCLINGKGEIIKQFSLNEIVNEYNGQIHSTNYHELLAKREGNRDESRKNWQTIETIKELKEGYLSQVINVITKLMVEYQAVVALEDLNMGFMRGRQKVEKQVYQKFEMMLINKLNYLVDKRKKPAEPAGVLRAYQLSNKFESFQKMGKQSGFLFYIPAWNTSKIDPVTGFVNLFDTRYTNEAAAKSFFNKFDRIGYNADTGYFEFEFDYTNFTTRAEETRTRWTLCTHGERIETFRNPEKNGNWDNRVIDITREFVKLFERYGIEYASADLKRRIVDHGGKEFYQSLMYLMKMTLQMRNSITGSDIDYLLSPVADAQGHFFDSRTASANLPKDADANGAYNIARKGLWMIEQIKKADDVKKIRFALSNKEWLQYVQRT